MKSSSVVSPSCSCSASVSRSSLIRNCSAWTELLYPRQHEWYRAINGCGESLLQSDFFDVSNVARNTMTVVAARIHCPGSRQHMLVGTAA